MQKIQDTCVHQIDPCKALPIIYKEQQILTIDKLVQLENTKVWYKYYHGLNPTRLQELMTEDSTQTKVTKQHDYNTRQKGELNLPCASGHYKKSFYVKGMKDYSNLPNSIKGSKTLKQFNTACKKHYLNA